jgi:NodT family efflux transporter outer membrane factor (OMF) lipoprotein
MSEKEKSQNIMASPSIEKSIEKAKNSNLFAEGDWPEEKWWQIFQCSTLDVWIEETFKQNPSLQAVQQRLNYAKQIAQIAKSRLFPYLFFDAKDNWNYLSKNGFMHLLNPSLPLHGNEIDLTLSFTYEFDFWGKYRNLFRAALGEALAREAEIYQTKLILSSALAQSYFAITISQMKQKLYEELYQVRLDRYELQQKMKEKALSSKLPPLLDEEKLAEAKQWVLAIQDEIEVETHFINVILGRSPDHELVYEDQPAALPNIIPLPNNLSLDLLSRRPDLMAQIWRVESLAHQVGAAKADFFPNISLNAFGGLESLHFSDLFNMQSKTGAFQPAIHLPIFTAGAIGANVKAKKAAFDEAVFQYNDMILKSVQEVTDLLSNITTIYSQKELQESIVLQSQERFFLTELRNQKGLDSSFDIFDFQEDLIQKKLRDLDLLYSQYAFLIKLIKSIGGGYKSSASLPIQARRAA